MFKRLITVVFALMATITMPCFGRDLSSNSISYAMINGAPINVLDWGVNTTANDNASAFKLLSEWVNSQYVVQGGKPIGIYFPMGTYQYSGGLDFQTPVYLFSNGDATLYYTGSGNAIDLGNLNTGLYPYSNAHYTVDGLRITSTKAAIHGIFLRPFVLSPRIINVVFKDFGSGAGGSNYCIYGYDNIWDAVIENVRMYTVDRNDANANFIGIIGVSPAGVSDGGNSRVTISNCFMAAYNDIDLGVYAQISGTGSRILGGSFVNSSYGIILTPDAQDIIIDSVYAEMANNALAYITTVSKTIGGNLYFPQGIVVKNAYINFHGHNIPMVKVFDSNVRYIDWTIDHVVYGGIVDGHLMIEQNDYGNQWHNTASGFVPLSIPSSNDDGRRVQITNPNLLAAEPWSNPGAVFGTEKVTKTTYALSQTDCGKIKRLTNLPTVVTVPNSILSPYVPVGAVIYLHNETGGNQTIVGASGVSLYLTGTSGGPGTRTIGPNGLARLINIQANVWLVDGPGVN
ncbi:hypothetical protein [Geothrix sp. 21YS21S-4]|uniref:hypothetical protein n=1 Tax=Geothrix sp. 21YS21S-4 TaxID=3068889 RepID=UPI0027B9BE03|nr:hypothetical protein [Geothrix sp. 21YS21S-4]